MAYKSRIPQIAAQIPARLDAALKAGAESIARDAQSRAPVASGRLRSAIHVEREGLGEYAVIAGDDNAFYGHLVEYGTAHTPARPFLIPALEARRATVLASAREALRGL